MAELLWVVTAYLNRTCGRKMVCCRCVAIEVLNSAEIYQGSETLF